MAVALLLMPKVAVAPEDVRGAIGHPAAWRVVVVTLEHFWCGHVWVLSMRADLYGRAIPVAVPKRCLAIIKPPSKAQRRASPGLAEHALFC
jgi:hypothetical protein